MRPPTFARPRRCLDRCHIFERRRPTRLTAKLTRRLKMLQGKAPVTSGLAPRGTRGMGAVTNFTCYERQHLAAFFIEAERDRGGVETGVGYVAQQGMHARRPRPGRPVHATVDQPHRVQTAAQLHPVHASHGRNWEDSEYPRYQEVR
jgi:hypothetical protein